MKRPVGTTQPKGAMMSMTMRPAPIKKAGSDARLDRLGVEAGKAPRGEVDPRIAAFERELERRRAKVNELLQQGGTGTGTGGGEKELARELAERRAKEKELLEELEALRQQLANAPAAEEDPYVAQLEGEVARLKFAAMAQSEAFQEQKDAMEVAMEKAGRLDEMEERMARMEAFLKEVEEERNGLASELERAKREAATAVAAMVGQQKERGAGEREAGLREQIADLQQQVRGRDEELKRQAAVMAEMTKRVEQRATSTTRPGAAGAEKEMAKSGAEGATGGEIEEDAGLEAASEAAATEAFGRMAAAQLARSGERISLMDKKAMRDPAGNKMEIVGVRDKKSGAVVACCGLQRKGEAMEMKLVSVEDEQRAEHLVGQMVVVASKVCRERGAEELVALVSGARAEADKKWGKYGFKFAGVGPGPGFEGENGQEGEMKTYVPLNAVSD